MQAYFPKLKVYIGNIFYYFLKVHVLWIDLVENQIAFHTCYFCLKTLSIVCESVFQYIILLTLK